MWWTHFLSVVEIALGDAFGASMTGTIVLAIVAILAAIWRWHRKRRGGGAVVESSDLIVVGLAGVVLFGALALGGYLWGRGALGIASTTQATGVSAAPAAVPSQTEPPLVESAFLRLLMRPNQEPQQLSADNVWRWAVFKSVGKDAGGHEFPIGTYFFVTFDHPTKTNYRRIFSPSNPSLGFDLVDISERSMIISISNIDIGGATVEIHVSGSPL